MKYIIHGATGAQGSPLYKKMLKLGKQAVAAVRDPETLKGSPAIAVDNSSIDSLAAAYSGADGVFIHLPLGPDNLRLQYAMNIAKAIEISRPKRVVLSTSGWVADAPNSLLQFPSENAVPTLIREVERIGVSTATIAPRLFLENLLLPIVLEPVKKEDVLRYPLRADYKVSWCSHLDVADVAIELFANTSITGIVGVGQLPAVTGIELAESFTKHFGQQIKFESLMPEEFGKMLAPLLGEEASAGVAAVYKAHYLASDNAINSQTSAQKLLGVKPRTVQQWLADIGIK